MNGSIRPNGAQWRIGGRGVKPPPSVFFACQYMKIPANLDPNPPPLKNPGSDPPPLEAMSEQVGHAPYFWKCLGGGDT